MAWTPQELAWRIPLGSRQGVPGGGPLMLLVSPAALAVASLWLGEAPTLAALAGGALTLAGVATVQLGARTAPRVPSIRPQIEARALTRPV